MSLAANNAFSRDIRILDPQRSSLPVCGSQNSPPFARPGDSGRRECGRAALRNYTPRYPGIGFRILDLESEACFVPDEAYRLLDQIVDDVKARVPKKSRPYDKDSIRERILAIGRATSAVLTDKGFGLLIPTETLGDTLISRSASGESPRHIFDCDTASMIFLTVAQALSTPASLVEITLPTGDQHNYVRWQIDRNTEIDWDPNGRSQCVTPANTIGYQGKPLSRDQTMSYVLTLRAELWARQNAFDRAIRDYRAAMRLFPERPGAYTGFAWLVATKDFPERAKYRQAALAAAERAVALRRNPDYLDTLACASAFAGNFPRAASYEREAHEGVPSNAQYKRRLEQFEASKPADCTGAE
jgi:tetratricopeptide (TPR) repeat protein